jgi:hypothetical protein
MAAGIIRMLTLSVVASRQMPPERLLLQVWILRYDGGVLWEQDCSVAPVLRRFQLFQEDHRVL